MSHTQGINYADLQTYFKFLAPNDNLFTVAFLDAAGKGACSGYGTHTGSLDQIVNLAQQLYESQQATLHATLNQTNDSGRRKSDIRAARVLAVDLDSLTADDVLQDWITRYQPNLVVNTSPQKYHLYWSIDACIPLDRWSVYQLTLAYHFNADWRLSEINKTLRVPGIPRVTKEGNYYMPSIIYYNAELEPLSEADLLNVFPFLATDQEEAKAWKKQLQDAERKAHKELQAHLNGSGHLNGHSKVQVPDGASRNTSLYKLAFHQMAKFVPGEPALSEEMLNDFVWNANEALEHPLDDYEIQSIVQSAYSGGLEEWEKAKVAYEATKTEPSGFQYDFQADEFLRANPYSNMALVSRIFQRFGDRLMRVGNNVYGFHPYQRVWRLQQLDSPEINLFYKACVSDMISEDGFLQTYCLTSQGDLSLKKKQQATDRVLALSNYRNVVQGVKSHHALPAMDFSHFDANEHYLHVANGVVNMLTGELRNAMPEDRLLNRSPLPYVAGATCPRFIEFLLEVFAENDNPEGMVSFMQQLFGYSISGSIREQKLFLHYGAGCNGKSKILSVFRHLIGDYTSIVDPDEFASGRFGAMTRFERLGVKLEGKRCVVIDDMETESVWNEMFVKNCTSPQIRARAEREKSREIVNRAKVHLGLNTVPKPQTEVHGFIRRLCIINYPRQFSNSIRESRRIDAVITEEAQGILAWAVEGYRLQDQQGGLQYPMELDLSIQEYTNENFVLPKFLRAHFEPDNSVHGIVYDDLVAQVQELLKSTAGATRRGFSKNEILNAFRSTFHIESCNIWDPAKAQPRKGYKVKFIGDNSIFRTM